MKDQFYLCYSSLVSANLIDGGMLWVGQCPYGFCCSLGLDRFGNSRQGSWEGEGELCSLLVIWVVFFALHSFGMALGMRLRGAWVGCDPV